MKAAAARLVPVLIVTVFFLAVGSRDGLANSSYLAAFEAAYPGAVGTAIDDCALCHDNAYKSAFAAAGRLFVPIEPSDSDGDGYTNLTEIAARTFPGSAPSVPDNLLFVDNFSNARSSTVPNWRVKNAVGARGRLVTSATLPSRAFVSAGAAALLDDGVITADIKLTARAAGTPTGGFLVWYRDGKNNVSVKITRTGVSIVEKIAGTANVLAAAPIDIGAAVRRIQVEFESTGLVEVLVGGGSVVSGTATGFAPGKVGVYGARTKALFDNVVVSRGPVPF